MDLTFPLAFSYPWYLLLLLVLVPLVSMWRRGGRPLRLWRTRSGIQSPPKQNPSRTVRDRVSLALRCLILVLVILSLAGLQWVQASDELAVVFLLDVSDSIDAAAREQAVSFIRDALRDMSADDRAALVLFGADALVERPLSQATELGQLFSIPATAHTDPGEAVRLGLALLPSTAQRRLVLLSDGQANVPGGEMAAQLAAASGVELDVVSLPARSGDEAWIDALQVPHVLYEGETFSLLVRVRRSAASNAGAQPALLRLFAGPALVEEQTVLLNPGLNSFLFTLSAGEPGFNTFTAQLVSGVDVFYQNNVLGAFALVRGAPQVLVVARPEYEDVSSGLPVDDAKKLTSALERAGLDVERVVPALLPPDLLSLGAYASVILVNVPASELSSRQMQVLQSYVRDLGRGLVCVGGQESYGVGGYFKTPLEETLPVEMTIRDRTRIPHMAIVFAIDKSGSMDVAAQQDGGIRKIDLAKEAILRSLELLTPGDQVGVVAFDDTAQWVWPQDGKLALLTDIGAVQQQVATLRAGGGTDIYAGLGAAVKALEESQAQLKHVILLTDGGASQEGLLDLVARLRAIDGTLSTIGVGQDVAPFLRPLAIDAGGRYHYTDTPASIPQIFVQETTLAQRAYLVEETFYPALAGHSAIVDGIDAVPALYGYVATSIKPAAQAVLVSAQDDPILAQWQYGLGRAVAWTSDAKAKWGREWVGWEQFPRFWAQVVRWTIVERDEPGLETQIVDQGERVHVTVDIAEAEGEYGNDMRTEVHLIPRVWDPSLPSSGQETVVLRQTAPGRYEGDLSPEADGVYLVRVIAAPADAPGEPPLTQVTGFVRSFSPEYRSFGTDEAALLRLAQAGGGQVIADPASVFVHDQDAVRTFTDVWPWLMGVAIVLLPFDIAVRRLAWDMRGCLRDVVRRRGWIRARLGKVRAGRGQVQHKQPSEGMARLMAAKERAPARRGPAGEAEPWVETEQDRAAARDDPKDAPEAVRDLATKTPLPGASGAAGMTSRLLAAKRRARQEGASESNPRDAEG